MSRSRRLPAYYHCCGARPRQGKQVMSRWLRRKVRNLIHTHGEDFDFAHPQDKIRGKAGSRSDDYGWIYFGDGRVNPYHVIMQSRWEWDAYDGIYYGSEKWYRKLCRK